MKNDTLENRMKLSHNKEKISDEKLLMGSLKGKYPITLDDGKTTIFISDLSKAEETKLKYELQRKSRFPSNYGKNQK
jgi:hypothetical protein